MNRHAPKLLMGKNKRFSCQVCGMVMESGKIKQAVKEHREGDTDAAAAAHPLAIIDLPDAAELLGMSRGELRRLVAAGVLPARQTGRSRAWFFWAEIEAVRTGVPLKGFNPPQIIFNPQALKKLGIPKSSYDHAVDTGRLSPIFIAFNNGHLVEELRRFRRPARGAKRRVRPEDAFITKTETGRYAVTNPLASDRNRTIKHRGHRQKTVRYVPATEYPDPAKDKIYRSTARRLARKNRRIAASYSGTRYRKKQDDDTKKNLEIDQHK